MNKQLLYLAAVIYGVSGYAVATNATPFDGLRYRCKNAPFINVDKKIINHFNDIYSKNNDNYKIKNKKTSLQAIAVICQAVLEEREYQDILYPPDELGLKLNSDDSEITYKNSECIMGVLIRDYLCVLRSRFRDNNNNYELSKEGVYNDWKKSSSITYKWPRVDSLATLEWSKRNKNTALTYCKSVVNWIKFLEIEKLFRVLFGGNSGDMDMAPPPIDGRLQKNIQNKIQLNKQLIEENKVIFKKIEHPNWYLGNKNQTIGLNNIGATCYMNATLQCLSHIKSFSEWILRNEEKLKKGDKCLSYDYYNVLKELWYTENGADGKPNKTSFSPYEFKAKISEMNSLFVGVTANDSKDLINFMLETLHSELNQSQKNSSNQGDVKINQTNEREVLNAFRQEYSSQNDSPIVDNFYGIYETKSQCLGCGIEKYNAQVYSFLEFPLLDAKKYRLSRDFRNPYWLELLSAPTQDCPQKNIFKQIWDNYTLTLKDCFEHYRRVDLMSGQNQMYCNKCDSNQNSNYATRIYSAPETLIINLNRGKGAVHQIPIQIPAILNISDYIADKQNNDGKYYLSGIVSHFGPSSMSGHFIAHCRDNELDKSWVKYNDSLVSVVKANGDKKTTEFVLESGMPYILFYSKKKEMNALQNRINKPCSQGLKRLGYTYYMNSAVQLLAHIKPISEYILQLKENNKLNKELHPITYQYANLLEKIWFGNESFAPEEFQRNVEASAGQGPYFYNFDRFRNNDAYDLLNFLVQALHDELNTATQGMAYPIQAYPTNLDSVRLAALNNYIDKNLSKISEKTLHCHYSKQKCQNNKCNYTTYNYQTSNITIFNVGDAKLRKQMVHSDKVTELSIMDCVDQFTKEETVVGSNSQCCVKCKGKYAISNRNILDTVSENWIVNLDYGKDKKAYKGNFKLDENINLKNFFNFTANTSGDYYLSGIVMYTGSGQDLGHYVTFSRMGKGEDWYAYDDDAVTKVDDFKSIADLFMHGNSKIPCMFVYTAVPDVKGQVNANQSQPQQQSLNNIKEQKFNKIKNEVEQKYNVTRSDNTRGLLNPKNRSCYINSVLQCLFHIKPLTIKLLADRIKGKLPTLDNNTKKLINSENENAKNTIIQRQESERLILRAYTDLLTDVYSRPENAYSDPTILINLLNRVNNIYDLNNAGDAYDVLTQFLPIIQNETLVKNPNQINYTVDKTNEEEVLNEYLKIMDRSTSTDVFAGFARQKTYCTECKRLTYSFENPLFLNVPLKDIMFKLYPSLATQYVGNPKGLCENTKNSVVTLDDALRYSARVEDFFGQNAQYCAFCNKNTYRRVQEEIYTSPNVLVVAMKNGDDNTGRVATKLTFPPEFDFASTSYVLKKIPNNEKYFLSGIVFHMGANSNQGHYVAVCRDAPNASWYLYNDKKAIKIDYSDTLKYDFPCLLFYQKFNWTLE